MGLDLWFRQDVARILASAQEASGNSLGAVPALDPDLAEAYQAGFADALRSVGIAFGISPAAKRSDGGPVWEWTKPAHTVLNGSWKRSDGRGG